jgi:hypothetical protein
VSHKFFTLGYRFVSSANPLLVSQYNWLAPSLRLHKYDTAYTCYVEKCSTCLRHIWAGVACSKVPTVTMVRAWMSEIRTRKGQKFFFSPKHPHRLWGAPCFSFNGYPGYFPGIKRSGHDVDHPPPNRSVPRNELSYTSISPIYLHGTNKDNLPFYRFVQHVCHKITSYPLSIMYSVIYDVSLITSNLTHN